MFIEEIVTSIDARIAALRSDIKPLQEAKAALLGGTPRPRPAQRRPAKAEKAVAAGTAQPEAKADPRDPRPTRAPRKIVVRAKADPVPAGKLVALLGASEGLTATALASQAGGNVGQVRVLLKELSDQGQVRRTGERRGTRWHVVSDEHATAEPAAEPKARRARRATGQAKPAATR